MAASDAEWQALLDEAIELITDCATTYTSAVEQSDLRRLFKQHGL
jgi:hypothetical protein